MSKDNIDVSDLISKTNALLEKENSLGPEETDIVQKLLWTIKVLSNQLNRNSSNSSTSPANDPNRKTKTKGLKFVVVKDIQKQHEVEEKSFYIQVVDDAIHYKCLNTKNNVVQDTITDEDLPEGIHIPESSKLQNLLAIKKHILALTLQRGHTKQYTAPGGQPGHKGATLTPVSYPDEIRKIDIDRSMLPNGLEYSPGGYVARQVINLNISKKVIEYRAEILIDENNNQYTAEFPENIRKAIQYGPSVKAKSTYLFVYQFIPCMRIQEQFKYDYNVPISTGTICNNTEEASNILEQLGFEALAKRQLINSKVAHADETSINLNGSKIWLHGFSNPFWTWLEPHDTRGADAMKDIGILPLFLGILCHDHWKPYYKFICAHALCNAHHLRELLRAAEHDGQQWAKAMIHLLNEINNEVKSSDNSPLSEERAKARCNEYREIIKAADNECPEVKPKPGTKRKPKQGKSRNLLDRLRDHENEVLLFIVEPLVPFTNNNGEGDIRMSKVKQKISGCFKSMQSAKNWCRVRSYIVTCQKNGVAAFEALEMLFNNRLPDFMQNMLDLKDP